MTLKWKIYASFVVLLVLGGIVVETAAATTIYSLVGTPTHGHNGTAGIWVDDSIASVYAGEELYYVSLYVRDTVDYPCIYSYQIEFTSGTQNLASETGTVAISNANFQKIDWYLDNDEDFLDDPFTDPRLIVEVQDQGGSCTNVEVGYVDSDIIANGGLRNYSSPFWHEDKDAYGQILSFDTGSMAVTGLDIGTVSGIDYGRFDGWPVVSEDEINGISYFPYWRMQTDVPSSWVDGGTGTIYVGDGESLVCILESTALVNISDTHKGFLMNRADETAGACTGFDVGTYTLSGQVCLTGQGCGAVSADTIFSVGTWAYSPDLTCPEDASFFSDTGCWFANLFSYLLVPQVGFFQQVSYMIGEEGYWPLSMLVDTVETVQEELETETAECALPTYDMPFVDVGTFTWDVCTYAGGINTVFGGTFAQSVLYVIFGLLVLMLFGATFRYLIFSR